MVRSKLGLKVLGSSILALGLVVFIADSSALATTGAQWTYVNPVSHNLLAFSEVLLPVWKATAGSESVSIEFTTGAKTKVQFKCTAFTLDGSPKLLLNGSISNGTATLKGCQTFLNGSGTPSSACLPKTNGAANDEIKTNELHGLLVLHKLGDGTKHHVILLLPLATEKLGNPLVATVQLGEECAIGESVPITGHLVLWDVPPLTLLEHKVVHLMEEFPALRLLKALGQAATILGDFLVLLSSPHVNYEWAGLTP